MSGEKAAFYGRTSTDEQKSENTIEAQVHLLRQECEKNGWEVAAEFLDDCVSSRIPLGDRLQGAALLQAAKAGAFQHVIVKQLDRLSRNPAYGGADYNKLRRLGAPVTFVYQRFDHSPAGRFTFQIFLANAEYEWELIRERTMAGRARKVGAGKYFCGIPPYGYEFVKCRHERPCIRSECRTLQPHPEQADWLRRMYAWVIAGVGVQGIVNRLEQEGVKPALAEHSNAKRRGSWHGATVHNILRATRYKGQATYRNGEGTDAESARLPMACPALVDELTWERAQQALNERRLPPKRSLRQEYVLRGLIRCGHCDGKYAAHVDNAGTTRATPVYYCSRRRENGPVKGGHRGIRWRRRAAELDFMVALAAVRLWLRPQSILRQFDAHLERVGSETDGPRADVVKLQQKLRALDDKDRRARELAIDGLLSKDDLRTWLAESAAQREQNEAQHAQAKAEAAETVTVQEAAASLREMVRRDVMAWEGMMDDLDAHSAEDGDDLDARFLRALEHTEMLLTNPAKARELVQRFVTKVVVEDDGSTTVYGPGNVTLPPLPPTDAGSESPLRASPAASGR